MHRATFETKAATTMTGQGTFTAVISTAAVDRVNDIVQPEAMLKALLEWTKDGGKKVPLHWDHSSKAEDIIGYVDPLSARVVGNEVLVDGWVDQDTERGGHAWRLIKSGTIGFSFGYLTNSARKRADGVNVISALDLFEVSIAPAPVNPGTRVVSWKNTTAITDDTDADSMHAVITKAIEATDMRVKADKYEREHAPVTITTFQW